MSNNNPLVSIIVPVYNVDQYLMKCLDSILSQTYQNLQIVLVEDGSIDHSADICDVYSQKDSRITVVHQKNDGLSSARNIGLATATGEYVGFVDSDDWIECDMFDVLLKNMLQYNADISIVDYCKDSETESCFPMKKNNVEIMNEEQALTEMVRGIKYQAHMCTKLYSRFIISCLYFSEEVKLLEDYVANAFLLSKAHVVVYQEYHCYHYIQRQSSLLHNINENYWTYQTAQNIVLSHIEYSVPKAKPYVEMAIQDFSLFTAFCLADDTLSKRDYIRLKEHIAPHINSESNLLLGKKKQLWISIFMLGRIPFLACRKVWQLLLNRSGD